VLVSPLALSLVVAYEHERIEAHRAQLLAPRGRCPSAVRLRSSRVAVAPRALVPPRVPVCPKNVIWRWCVEHERPHTEAAHQEPRADPGGGAPERRAQAERPEAQGFPEGRQNRCGQVQPAGHRDSR